MSQSKRWGSAPIEIMNLITAYSGQNCLETKWMFVNKHWLNFYLSKVYHSISIDLTTNKKLNKILHSHINIGKWIKCVSFEKLQPHDDFYQINILKDPLYLLMKQTPFVEEVEFSPKHNFNSSDWTYFSIILMNANSWKLLTLPQIAENNLVCSAHYFTCAHYMRHSLKKVNLSLAMMNVSNYDFLKEFPALEVLDIGEIIVKDFFDLDYILQSFPKLKGIAAKFSEDPNDPLRSVPKNRYPNLKEITLENFTPNLDSEIIAFTKCFPNISKVKIIGKKNLPWPANEISPTATQAFFDFLSFTSEYQITVIGDANAANLMEKWSDWIKPVRKSSLTIEFEDDPYSNDPGNIKLTIKNNKLNSDVISFHSNQNYSIGLAALDLVKKTACYVKLKNLTNDNGTNRSDLGTLLQKNCPNLETLILDNISFKTVPDDIRPPKKRLRSLEFYNCSLKATPFQKFTKQFQSLDFLIFEQCLFSLENQDNITKINMSNCEIGTMYISNISTEVYYYSYPQRRRAIVQCNPMIETMSLYFIVSVTCESSIIKYYVIINRIVVKIDYNTYCTIWSSILTGRVMHITVQVKSIQVLCIKLKNDTEYIKIVFP